jgi:serine/threonine-protein phosphatase 6 regulatory ankyrin repeat subunit B
LIKMLGCMHALLRARSDTHLGDINGGTAPQQIRHCTTAEVKGQPTTAKLFGQHAALSQPAFAAPDASLEAGEPVVSTAASLPIEIFESAENGELQKVVGWLREGGLADAHISLSIDNYQTATTTLLHAAAANGHLEMVRELLERGASVDLEDGLGHTALMSAAYRGHLSTLLFLLHHSASPELQASDGHTALMMAASEGHEACVQALLRAKANPDLQSNSGHTALMVAADQGQVACVKALLRAKANTELIDKDGLTALQWAEHEGHTAAAALIRQHATPPQPAAASPTAPPVVSYPASLPLEIFQSAERGELQKVVKWLRKGGRVDALRSILTSADTGSTIILLHAAAAKGHLEMARMLLKRGASVDLPSKLGWTALMHAAAKGHLSILLVLLQHSANPDLQTNSGVTALMMAGAYANGHESCVKALLRAKANTELLDKDGDTALQWAEARGHTATAELIRQHAPRFPCLGVSLCAVFSLAWPWVVLGVMALVAFSRTLMARLGQHRAAARQRRPHRPARHAKAQGRTTKSEPIRQRPAPPQPAAAVAPHTTHAARAARADAEMEKLLAEEVAEQAKAQAPSKKSKKKKKAGRAAAAAEEPSKAPHAAASAPPPAAAPKPAASEAALRVAIAGGGLSALEAALAAAPRGVREGRVGTEAWAMCDRLLKAQQEAEREAKQGAAAEAARLAAAVRAVAASKAREEAVTAAEAAAAAAAKADTLERAMADGGEGSSSGAAGPSMASEAVEVPDDYICPITAEIMTDPVSTVDGFTYEREAITEWLRTKDTSPVTGTTLESKTLIPNLSLRSMIRSFA